jgi:hypothetical protein
VIGCLITGYEPLLPTLSLPDPGDLHVLAAAIQGQAEVIVTLNLRDFPKNDLARYGLQAQSPDDFIADLIQTEAQAVFTAIRKLRSRLKNPPRSAQEYLGTLRQQPLPKTVAHLETVLDAI